MYAYTGDDPINGTDPTGDATYKHYSDGTVVVIQKFQNQTPYSNKAIEAQARRNDGKTSDGHQLIVVYVPGTGKDSVTIKVDKSLNDFGDNRSHTDKVNGREISIAPNAVGVPTIGHEMDHTLGAGDQYEGGVDSNGHTVPQDVPDSEGTIMRDWGGKPANQQTRDEILRNETRDNNTTMYCGGRSHCIRGRTHD